MFRQAFVRLVRAGSPQRGTNARLPLALTLGVRRLATAAENEGTSPIAAFLAGAATVTAASFLGYWQVSYAKQATVDYGKVKEEIAEALGEDANMAPTLVRLAWHASGTWDKSTQTGGSNGATMRFSPECNHGANAGLHIARSFLEPIKKAHPGISYADLWILAGLVAIEEMGGPAIPFVAGRMDHADGTSCPPEGRLPDADKGTKAGTIQHVRDIFYRMGFNDQEIVALIGAHAVGRAHSAASGYDGPWTRAETTFSNEFFRELLENKWTLKKWNGPEQYTDPTGELMMLPADMAFLWDPEFKQWCEVYAKDQTRFFTDFSSAFSRLVNFGLEAPQPKTWGQWLGLCK